MKSSELLVEVSSGQKCSDTESGWTMYIGSHLFKEEEEEEDDDDNNQSSDKNEPMNRDDNGESDDSMASDASSGPIELMVPNLSKNVIKASEAFDGLKNSSTTVNCNKKLKKIRDETRPVRRAIPVKNDELRERNNNAKADSAESQV